MKTLTLTAILALVSFPSVAQNFSCNRSRSATEATICNSPELSRLDNRLNRAYRRSGVSVRSQRAWLRLRDRCGPREGCIRARYEDRIEELRSY